MQQRESPQHGLDLRNLQGILKGGESGAAVTPGSAKNSLLYQKISNGLNASGPNKLAARTGVSRSDFDPATDRWLNINAFENPAPYTISM